MDDEKVFLIVVVVAIVFLIIGHLLFPNFVCETPDYWMNDDSQVWIEMKGQGARFVWNMEKEIFVMPEGMWYDEETDKYYCEGGCHTYHYDGQDEPEPDDFPNIPPIEHRRKPEPYVEPSLDEKTNGNFVLKTGKQHNFEIMFTEIESYGSIVLYDIDYYPYGVEVLLYNVSYVLYSDFCEYPKSSIIEMGVKAVFYKVDNQAIQPIPKFEVLSSTFSNFYNKDFGFVTVFEKIGYISCGGI